MNILFALILFYIGAAIGSFLSVIIYRYRHNKKGVLFGRSMCPKCGTALAAIDLIPIFSFTALRGRCRYCKKRIAPHYILIELITGLIFTLLYWKIQFISFDETAPFLTFSWMKFLIYLYAGVESAILIGVFFYDLLYKEIPNIFTYPGIGLAVSEAIIAHVLHFSNQEALFPSLNEIFYGLLIAFALFEGQRFLSKGKWIGLGDSILAYLMAILLGWKFLLIAIFAAYAMGTIVGLSLIVARKATMRSAIPFGPFLATGVFLAIFFGDALISFYTNYAAIF